MLWRNRKGGGGLIWSQVNAWHVHLFTLVFCHCVSVAWVGSSARPWSVALQGRASPVSLGPSCFGSMSFLHGVGCLHILPATQLGLLCQRSVLRWASSCQPTSRMQQASPFQSLLGLCWDLTKWPFYVSRRKSGLLSALNSLESTGASLLPFLQVISLLFFHNANRKKFMKTIYIILHAEF